MLRVMCEYTWPNVGLGRASGRAKQSPLQKTWAQARPMGKVRSGQAGLFQVGLGRPGRVSHGQVYV